MNKIKLSILLAFGAVSTFLVGCGTTVEYIECNKPHIEEDSSSFDKEELISDSEKTKTEGWVKLDYGDYWEKNIVEQVAVDNEIFKLTFTGTLKADEYSVDIPFVIENKTNDKIEVYVRESQMDGAMVDIKGVPEILAKTKLKDTYSLYRESLFEDNLESIGLITGSLQVKVNGSYVENLVPFEVNLK